LTAAAAAGRFPHRSISGIRASRPCAGNKQKAIAPKKASQS
jgi:hypothetical protein